MRVRCEEETDCLYMRLLLQHVNGINQKMGSGQIEPTLEIIL